MASDTTSLPRGKNFQALLLSYLTSKVTPSKSGEKKSGKKKRIEYQDEQAEEVQNFIVLWNLISLIREGF